MTAYPPVGLWRNSGGVDAFDLNVTHFDLANNYGPPPGSAKETLGRIVRNDLRGYRDELIISTQAGCDMWPGPYGEWGSRKYLIASLDQSLKRIGLDYVDIFYHHRPDPDTPLEETMGARSGGAAGQGALRRGSNYDAEQMRAASGILRNLGTPCLINQVVYHMFDRWVEPDLLLAAEQEGAGLILDSIGNNELGRMRWIAPIRNGDQAVSG